MAARYHNVIIDTCFLSCLHNCDPQCELLEIVIDHYGQRGIGDWRQLQLCTYCQEAIENHLNDHGISDEAVTLWMAAQPPDRYDRLARLAEDPADLKLLVYAVNNHGILLSCDGLLLQCCHLYDVPHRCLKAVMMEVDRGWGGSLLEGYSSVRQALHQHLQNHPFVQIGFDRHCQKCDPHNTCDTRQS